MQKEADEFLKRSAKVYTINRENWTKQLKKKGYEFSEDIYNDSIIKVYDAIIKKEVEGDYMGYWYTTFFNNTKRDLKYAYHNTDKTIDVFDYLDEKIDEQSEKILYNELISTILFKVRNKFSRKEFELFRVYLLCNISYDTLAELTGIKTAKEKIMKIKKYINETIKISDYQ